ncbi:hypothetical protein AK88_01714 [Plasmodium fragile]|uniref:Uncharacterized protein n=1 Tax=Plasmodium fragile TaxID=5857 RepID=A0A0D9QNM4_PLAFR|nr:uncharacterized protein AK88_01714 [Plasmodium fragile]KJP88634.1 hypothetical protein AK88_01714 [Plasmodium fragile]
MGKKKNRLMDKWTVNKSMGKDPTQPEGYNTVHNLTPSNLVCKLVFMANFRGVVPPTEDEAM